MELIKKANQELSKNGKYKISYGIFKCKKCLSEVKRPLSIGKKAKTCGCTRRNIETNGIIFIKRIDSRIRKDGKIDGYGLFKCPACGNEIERTISEGKKMKTCGCVHPKGTLKHGGYQSRLYHIWNGMKQRCSNKLSKDYSIYGERGIFVCSEWDNDFEKFRTWATDNEYSDNLQIDRIDNNDGYYPENCRWVTVQINSTNRRSSKLSKEMSRMIFNKVQQGELSQEKIASIFNISQQHVSDISRGRRWATIR